jgi:ribosomal protein S18 acetylase RimI-like enzyme
MDQVELRAARAEDVDVAVPLIYSSGPDAFDFVFGDAPAFLRRAYLDGRGEFGYLNHIAAEVGGDVVGVGAAYSGDVAASFTIAAARQILRHYGPRGPGVVARGLRTERVIRPPKKGMQYIGHLGVIEPMRGHGVGTALIRHFLEDGRARGFRTAELDVAVTNVGGQRLYERLGFRVAAERESTLRNASGSVSAHRRMVLQL